MAWWECGLFDLDWLWERTRWDGIPFGGDIVVSGGGGGGGRVSLPADMLRPLVGVLEDGVLVLLGGAGGGWLGRALPPLVGVPPWYSDSELRGP